MTTLTKEHIYKNPIGLTQQFRHCGNPFRIDTYRGCDFGCKYCFANNRGGNIKFIPQVADIEKIKKIFSKALDDDAPSNNITIELLRHRVPLHLGGMSDPFQTREWTHKVTYELLKLSNKYNYPILISTKQSVLPTEYWEILNPELHAFQISLFSDNIDLIRQFETNTPTPQQRIEFIKQLHNKGFWVGVRLQPLVEIDSAISMVKSVNGYIDYLTVEHLKISNDNRKKAELLFKISPYKIEDYKCTGRNYELKREVKLKNIQAIKEVCECPVGCGDNDLHEESDSNCCCGIDTINKNFDNWLKYNAMNIKKNGIDDYWYPKNSCHGCFNSECIIKEFDFKGYVDNYIEKGLVDKKCNFQFKEDKDGE